MLLIMLIGAVSAVSAADLNAAEDVGASDDVAVLEDVDDNVVSIENDENVLSASPKNFSQLYHDINFNGNDEIYLTSDYAFDYNKDYDLHDGVTILRPVTIHGNGHTIDGKRIAAIFKSSNPNVIIQDLTFKNGNSNENGGAISGECFVWNCTFIGNHAGEDGGALYNVYAQYCNFVNNSANGCGGAMYGGAAFQYLFINNKVWDAINCQGGAMFRGYAENCAFYYNFAGTGGAMYGDYGEVFNCIFVGNSAEYIGGALYKCKAKYSNFTQNNATWNGGAMYGGSAEHCIFYDNFAAGSPNNVDRTEFVKATLTANDFASYYSSGDSVKVNLVDVNGTVVKDCYITIKVYNGTEFMGHDYFLSGSGWSIDQLDAGTYNAVLSVDFESYDVKPVNIALSIDKTPATISASSTTAVYNVNKCLVVTLKNNNNKPVSGVKVTVNIKGLKTLTTDKNGQVKFQLSKITPKTYNAVITCDGKNVIAASKKVTVTVKKATVKLTAKTPTFKAKVKTKSYTVVLKDNTGKAMNKAKLTLSVKGKTFKATTNSKGKATFKITNLKKKGQYQATIKFASNQYYSALTKKVKINVKN